MAAPSARESTAANAASSRHPIFHDPGEQRGGARPFRTYLRRQPAPLDILFLDGGRELREARDVAAAVDSAARAIKGAYNVHLHCVIVNGQRLAFEDFGRYYGDANAGTLSPREQEGVGGAGGCACQPVHKTHAIVRGAPRT